VYPILLVGGMFMCPVAPFVAGLAYWLFGIETTRGAGETQAALDAMADVEVPSPLLPDSHSREITGWERVEFRSPSGRSYLLFRSGERAELQHESTLRDAFDSGRRASGRRAETPIEERTMSAILRGKPAAFIYRRYAGDETVSGYFQGKVHPVQFEAHFSFDEAIPGTGVTLVENIR
jgi:hypothetical protein